MWNKYLDKKEESKPGSLSFAEKYSDLPVRGIQVDLHSRFLKIAPTAFNGKDLIGNTEIKRQEIYQALAAAKIEAQGLGLSLPRLQLGKETHSVRFEKTLNTFDSIDKINIILNIKNSSLKSFIDLSNRFKTDEFILGAVPFHSPETFTALEGMLLQTQSIAARVSTVFLSSGKNKEQTRRGIRCYIGVTDSPVALGLKEFTAAGFDFFETKIAKKKEIKVQTNNSHLDL